MGLISSIARNEICHVRFVRSVCNISLSYYTDTKFWSHDHYDLCVVTFKNSTFWQLHFMAGPTSRAFSYIVSFLFSLDLPPSDLIFSTLTYHPSQSARYYFDALISAFSYFAVITDFPFFLFHWRVWVPESRAIFAYSFCSSVNWLFQRSIYWTAADMGSERHGQWREAKISSRLNRHTFTTEKLQLLKYQFYWLTAV